MKIVERNDIDVQKWDKLVQRTEGASFFSYAWYLDVVAENWCVLVNDNYSSGIALPYVVNLGVKTLYTPVFARYYEVLGDSNGGDFEKEIKKTFQFYNFAVKQPVFSEEHELSEYQVLSIDLEQKFSSQAKRSLKKALKNGLEIQFSSEYDSVLSVVSKELNHKIEGINEISLATLGRLFETAKNENCTRVFHFGQEGGIVCLEKKGQLLYLKGTVTPEFKKNGGMYMALNSAIQYAKGKGLHFDFGGSRVEGVKRFNHNLGGKDEFYYCYLKEDYPFWYRFLKNLKRRLKK